MYFFPDPNFHAFPHNLIKFTVFFPFPLSRAIGGAETCFRVNALVSVIFSSRAWFDVYDTSFSPLRRSPFLGKVTSPPISIVRNIGSHIHPVWVAVVQSFSFDSVGGTRPLLACENLPHGLSVFFPYIRRYARRLFFPLRWSFSSSMGWT